MVWSQFFVIGSEGGAKYMCEGRKDAEFREMIENKEEEVEETGTPLTEEEEREEKEV